MTNVNIYVINGMITVETLERQVLHRMSGFGDEAKSEVIIDALRNIYVVVEVYK